MALTKRLDDERSEQVERRLRLVQPGERAAVERKDPWEVWQSPVYALAGLGGFLAMLDAAHRGAYLAEIWTVLLLGVVLTESWRDTVDGRSRAALAGLVALHAGAVGLAYPWLAHERYLPAAAVAVVEFGLMTWVQGWMRVRARGKR